MKKIVGIIGGMGPAATCDLMEKIIALTDAATDQEHIHVIADVNTDIPDRTAAILHGGPDPAPEMIRSARRLETAGAELLLLPCNTAHYFYDRVAAAVGIPLLHMPRLTARTLAREGVRRAAVLATDGTVRSGVYDEPLRRAGIEPILPPPERQEMIMRLIYDGVKGRRVPLESFPVRALLAELRDRGAERFVLAIPMAPKTRMTAFTPRAKMMFCRATAIVFRAIRIATAICDGRSVIRTASAAATAASEPIPPMAIPRSARARTGASLIPSPTNAIFVPAGRAFSMISRNSTFCSGRSSA